MKAIAASIVLLAGCHLLANGPQIHGNNEMQNIVSISGFGISALGLWLLFVEFRKDKNN